MDLINDLKLYLETDNNTATIYLETLAGNITKEELEEKYSECSSILEYLYLKRLIMECPNAREEGRTDLIPISPDYSLPAILLSEAWKVDSNLHTLKDVSDLSDANPLKERYRLLKKLLPNVKKAYITQTPYNNELLYIVRGINQISTNIATQISEASKSIYAMMSPPQLMGEIVWESIKSAMDRGVVYHRITEFNEVSRHGIEIANREINDTPEQLFVLKCGSLPERFYVFDNNTVVFFDKNTTTRNYKKQIEVSRNTGLANRFLSVFKSVLDSSIPFSELLPKLFEFRSRIKEKWSEVYNERELEWLLDILNNGVFYSKSKYNEDFIMKVEEKGIINGTLLRQRNGDVVINYSIDEIVDKQ